METIDLDPCNRCCSKNAVLKDLHTVCCLYCNFTESLEVWQLRGWRSLIKYPPTYKGIIFVYGATIGRTIANWDSDTKSCDKEGATHWLRTPDPRIQVNM